MKFMISDSSGIFLGYIEALDETQARHKAGLLFTLASHPINVELVRL